jgi:hypothetical protein
LQSTLFNAIVENGKAAAANFPFCTIEPNVGIVTVPDPRLNELSRISKSKETVSAAQQQQQQQQLPLHCRLRLPVDCSPVSTAAGKASGRPIAVQDASILQRW